MPNVTPGGSATPTTIVIGGSPLMNQAAPDFDLVDLDGQPVRLSDYRGRPVIVNFWASWCVPCRTEFPLFKQAVAAHTADGLVILGIVHEDGADAARAFAAAQGATWPMLLDADETAWKAYGPPGLPTSFYIDRTGVIRLVSYGPPASGSLEELLAKIL